MKRRRRLKSIRGVRGQPWRRDDSYMMRYEERIIMRDVEAMTSGGNPEVSVKRLRLFAPMRYSPRLKGALERLRDQGRLRRTRKSTRGHGNVYVPVEDFTTKQEAA